MASNKMKSAHFRMLVLVVSLGLFTIGCSSGVDARTPIRIGWQVSWATQGQLAQTLVRTNALEKYGLKGELKGFSYGGPLNEAALSGDVDVIFTADQPAVSLLARGGDWTIVARLIKFRATIVVPPDSDIRSVKDLKGKVLGIPFGATTHRIALGMLKDAGLNPERDLEVRNIDILEQASVVQAGTSASWGEIDAFASWDPYIAIFESKNLARTLDIRTGTSVVVMSDKYIREHKNAVVSFLKAYLESFLFYAKNQKTVDRWFVDAARIEFDPSLLSIAASYEPNIKADSIKDIDVTLTEADVKAIIEGATFAKSLGLIKNMPNIRSNIDQSYLKEAASTLNKSKPSSLGLELVK